MNYTACFLLRIETDSQGNKAFPYLLSYQYKVVSWFDELVDNVGGVIK
ncbi:MULTISPECIES: hypothetical protein [unclassified Gilliamella]|nr:MULTISPECIES: hypothetical protein [unclassified Gilliamella]MWP50347.1 hypothetical protein [Gilliamella sp. Lep-s35]MWP70127.1 hypothetical protein [Gilliamella sp. Lep-s5]MWP78240.1 hypothetical protein [Gilliamella sp. Lep-s21]